MMRPTRRQVVRGAGVVALLGSSYIGGRFHQALRNAELRVSGRSSTIMTPFGSLEYAMEGSGPPVLMIHGTGGGFDQGLFFASALRDRGHKIISPSRFGYLQSAFPADPSPANQADAFVTLLDHLGIDRLAVVGGSAGALSATAFALRHTSRCSALVLLVPAANVSERDPVAMTAIQKMVVRLLLNSDFIYWSTLQAAPEQLVGTLLATDPAVLAKVNSNERARAFAILSDMMPIQARARGMLNDARQSGHPAGLDFSRLDMPVLILSAEDDRFGTAATARTIAGRVPQATLAILPDGGHIWLGHDESVAERMHSFLGGR
jgi:2-hydroxy-6-oxonona-2,4-dienedioate hydrolase